MKVLFFTIINANTVVVKLNIRRHFIYSKTVFISVICIYKTLFTTIKDSTNIESIRLYARLFGGKRKI